MVGSTSNSRPKRYGKPKEHELDRIDCNGEPIRIISSTAGRWCAQIGHGDRRRGEEGERGRVCVCVRERVRACKGHAVES